VKREDLEKCFEFSVKYHLNKTKLSSNRTTGQYRGLGGIIDSFVIGKLIELGVANIIEENSGKGCLLDFEIHDITKDNVSDPDIIKIVENKIVRDPELFVEIKNVSPHDRWIGLTAEQFKTILSHNLAKTDLKRIYLIYASLETTSSEGDMDPLGIFLKDKLSMELLKEFCDIGELFVVINYIITGEDLQEYGTKFDEGSYFYETEIIAESSERTLKKIQNNDPIYKKVKLKSNKIPIIMWDRRPVPKEYGDFIFEGNIEVYKKENKGSDREYIYAKEYSVIKNKVLGIFELAKGKLYDCRFTTVGMNPTLKRNNVWIAQRNLNNITKKSQEELVYEIRKNI